MIKNISNKFSNKLSNKIISKHAVKIVLVILLLIILLGIFLWSNNTINKNNEHNENNHNSVYKGEKFTDEFIHNVVSKSGRSSKVIHTLPSLITQPQTTYPEITCPVCPTTTTSPSGGGSESFQDLTRSDNPGDAFLGSDKDYKIVKSTETDLRDYYQLSLPSNRQIYGIRIQSSYEMSSSSGNKNKIPRKIILKYSLSSPIDDDAFMTVPSPTNNSYYVFSTDGTNSRAISRDEIDDIYFTNPVSARHIRLYVINTHNDTAATNDIRIRADLIIQPQYYFSIQSLKSKKIPSNTSIKPVSDRGLYLSHINRDEPLQFYSDKIGRREIYILRTLKGDLINFTNMTLGENSQQFDAFIVRSYQSPGNYYCKIDEDTNRVMCNDSITELNNLMRFKLSLDASTGIEKVGNEQILVIQDLKSGKFANENFEFTIGTESDANHFIVKKIDNNEIKNIVTVNQYVDKKEADNLANLKTCLENNIYYFNLRRCYNSNTLKNEHAKAIINREGGVPEEVEYSAIDDGPGVTMYEHIHYGGKSTKYKIGSYVLNDGGNIKNNMISSFIVNPGYSVIVYTNSNFSSGGDNNGVVFTPGKYDLTFVVPDPSNEQKRIYNNEGTYVVNDTISSFIVDKLQIYNSNQGVTMYKHINFGGSYKTYGYGSHSLNDSGDITTNMISSFEVYPGYKVTVYDSSDHSGTGVVFTAGRYDLISDVENPSNPEKKIFNNQHIAVSNDTISSFSVENIQHPNNISSTIKYKYSAHTNNSRINGPRCQNDSDTIYRLLQAGSSLADNIPFNANTDTYKPELYEGKKIGQKYNKSVKYHRPRSLDEYIPEVIKICVPKDIINSDSTATDPRINDFKLKTKIFNILDDDGNPIEQEFTVTSNAVNIAKKCKDSNIVNNLYKIKKTSTVGSPHEYELVSPSEPDYNNIDCGCNCLNSKEDIKNYRDTNSYIKGILNNLITRTDDVLSRRNQEITDIQTDEESILNQPETQDYLNYEKTNLIDTNRFIKRDEIINYYNVKGQEGFYDSSNTDQYKGLYKIFDGQFVLLDNCKLKIDDHHIIFMKLNTPIYKFKYDKTTPFYSPYSTFEGVKYRVILNDKMVHDIETNNLENLFLSIGLKVPNFIYISKHTDVLDDGRLNIYYKFSNREYTTLFQMTKIE